MHQRLTVLIPCRNERVNIRACVESARTIADEVLIADSGSTDGTLEIIDGIEDCRLIRNVWNGYSAFKNWAIAQATHSWVLVVDADERVTEELADEIRSILADPDDDIDGYRIRHRTFFLGHEIRFSGRNTTSACRLFRRDVCRYKNVRVHEDIDLPSHRVRLLKHRFIHFEYRDYDHYFAKRLHYTKLGARDRWEAGRRAGFFGLIVSPFLRFVQLYVFRLGFLDGLAGLQLCMLTAFINSYVKQARLWEMEHLVSQELLESPTAAAIPIAGGASNAPTAHVPRNGKQETRHAA
jgi:glycosyltransferase involved in cell wall biosynthesis